MRRRIPPNLKFEVDDVEREWAYPFKFDYIISRYMASSINDWPKFVERVYECVDVDPSVRRLANHPCLGT